MAFMKSTKEICEVLQLDFREAGMALIRIKDKRRIGGLLDKWVEFKGIELLQYTGSKDINEVPVYNRDLLEDEERFLWEVVWDEQEVSYRLVNVHIPANMSIKDARELIKVGNMLENPELLESGVGQ